MVNDCTHVTTTMDVVTAIATVVAALGTVAAAWIALRTVRQATEAATQARADRALERTERAHAAEKERLTFRLKVVDRLRFFVSDTYGLMYRLNALHQVASPDPSGFRIRELQRLFELQPQLHFLDTAEEIRLVTNAINLAKQYDELVDNVLARDMTEWKNQGKHLDERRLQVHNALKAARELIDKT